MSIKDFQNGLIFGASAGANILRTIVDDFLSTTSINPVQNKVITEKINEIDSTLPINIDDNEIITNLKEGKYSLTSYPVAIYSSENNVNKTLKLQSGILNIYNYQNHYYFIFTGEYTNTFINLISGIVIGDYDLYAEKVSSCKEPLVEINDATQSALNDKLSLSGGTLTGALYPKQILGCTGLTMKSGSTVDFNQNTLYNVKTITGLKDPSANQEAVSKIYCDRSRFKYSISPETVGTWIDGSLISQKTISLGGISANSTKEVQLNTGSLQYVVDSTGFVIANDGRLFKLSYNTNDGYISDGQTQVKNSGIDYFIVPRVSKPYVKITNKTFNIFTEGYLTIWYTLPQTNSLGSGLDNSNNNEENSNENQENSEE